MEVFRASQDSLVSRQLSNTKWLWSNELMFYRYRNIWLHSDGLKFSVFLSNCPASSNLIRCTFLIQSPLLHTRSHLLKTVPYKLCCYILNLFPWLNHKSRILFFFTIRRVGRNCMIVACLLSQPIWACRCYLTD